MFQFYFMAVEFFKFSLFCFFFISYRLLFWYLDPVTLKHDVSKILKHTTERPFLCLKEEFHERLDWRAIVVCLALSPTMFIETRALLHNWFLLTCVSISESCGCSPCFMIIPFICFCCAGIIEALGYFSFECMPKFANLHLHKAHNGCFCNFFIIFFG